MIILIDEHLILKKEDNVLDQILECLKKNIFIENSQGQLNLRVVVMKEEGSQIIVDFDKRLDGFKDRILEKTQSLKKQLTHAQYLSGALNQISKFATASMTHLNVVFISEFKQGRNYTQKLEDEDTLNSLKMHLRS